ncbi:coniferyl aldehyde dehydrogenase [Arenimonas sp.]|uniref:coniferyl aldehyde dehydrogenase n=1 Tax=Arenimonas sp. TaxID=1872635 RepID=UPI0025BD5363|nr:coniferyl aldehyde dehydrogenase [Arenimonas sp.]
MDTPAHPDHDLRPLLEQVRAAHRRQPPSYRQRMDDLARLGEVIRAHRDELVKTVSADFGRRSRHETLAADVMVTLDEIKYLRSKLRAWMRPERRGLNLAFLPARGEIRRMPLGVVGIVAPWNYPIQLALIPLADAIAAGNHVLVKPSEHTPRTSALLARLLAEAFPSERVAVVQGDAAIGAAFTRLPFEHLVFTGSTTVGRAVMAAAADHLTPLTLELGGKSPALVAPGYPIEQAADRIAAGKCFNAGQTCVAPDYVLVPRAQRDEFVRAYLASVRRRYPTLAANPDYTAVVNHRQADRLRDWIDDARDRGVSVIQYRPDSEPPPPGVEVIPPTVLLDPPDEAKVMQEEIFGPLLPVKSYDDHDAAIAYINGRDRPLAFYPFDRDRARLQRTLDAVVAGGVCVNDCLIQFGQHSLPVGGVGPSGMGEYHGHAGFLAFSKSMPVLYQSRLNGMSVFDPPFGKLADFVVKLFTR